MARQNTCRARAPSSPTDPCVALLRLALDRAPRPSVWLADEHITPDGTLLPAHPGDLRLRSNRVGVAREAQRAGLEANFCDADLAASDAAAVVYRVSKEKALVHHIINTASAQLPAGAELWLCGGKQEGILTYIEKATTVFGPMIEEIKGEHTTRLARLRRDPACTARLDDRDYAQLRCVADEDGITFFSKPGQFGWEKVDEGSRMLVGCLPAQGALGRVLDLGCGYGYLALHAARLGASHVTATDNNAAAILSCRHNLAVNGAQGEAVADECAESITERFDTVLCNPPFHQGFSTRGDLTDRFLAAAAQHLTRAGTALFVVNQFIPLETRALEHFMGVDLVDRNRSFKVLRLTRPR